MKAFITNKGYFILLLIPLITIVVFFSYLYYSYRLSAYKAEAEKELKAIAQLKIDRIANWYADELNDALLLSKNSFLLEQIRHYLSNPTTHNKSRIQTFLKNLCQEHGYSAIFITDNSSNILFTSDEQATLNNALHSTITKHLQPSTVATTDMFRIENNSTIYTDYYVLLHSVSQKNSFFIVFRHNISNDLQPLITEWPTISKTAETILSSVSNDSIEYLIDLRHRKNTALSKLFSLKDTLLPEVRAANGYIGTYEGVDYRWIRVFSYISPVPGTPWYLISKIDASEVFADFNTETILILLITFLTICTIIVATAFYYNYRQKNLYRRAWQAETEYRTTLYSIGDAVISTDPNGNVKYLNPIAEQLTGWTEQEAIGKPLDVIFNIINEDTREKVDNPVTRILREGIIVGLANHTILVNKNGAEIPIADSGAPIKDNKGNIIGVILVFRDQTHERTIQRQLDEARLFAESIIETLSEALLVIDEQYRVVTANRSFCTIFHQQLDHLKNKIIYDLFDQQWNQPDFRQQVEHVVNKRQRFNDFVLTFDCPIHGKKYLLVNGSLITRQSSSDYLVLLTFRDNTEQYTAQEQLRKSELKLRSIFSVLPDLILILNEEGRYIEIPPFNPHLLYKPANELLGKTVYDIFPEEQARQFHAAITTVLKSQKKVSLDYKLKIQQQDYWFSATVLPYQHNQVLLIARDITERKRIEQELRESEEWFRKLANSTATSIFIYQGTRFVYVNKAAVELTGYTAEELLSINFWDIVHPDHRELIRERGLARQRGENVPNRYEFKIVRKDGTVRWVDFSATKIDWYGSPAGMGTIIDITERKQAEEQLKERERTYHTLLNNIPGFAYRCLNDKDWTMAFISDGCKSITGYKADDFINNATIAFNDIIHPQYRDLLWNLWQEKLPKREVFEYEYPIITKNGEERWVWERGRGIYNDQGTLLYLEGFITDITERKKAEEQLQKERQLLKTIINLLPDAIYAKDTSLRKTIVNKVDLKNLGVEKEEDALGKDDFAFYPKQIADQFYQNDKMVLEGHPIINKEEKIIFPDGSEGYLLTSKVPLYNPHTGKIEGLVGIGHNITERKKAEEALRASESLYREFVENDLTGDFIAKPNGIILSCNTAFTKIFGFPSPNDAKNTSISSLFLSPERWQKIVQTLQEKHRLEYHEVQMRRLDGKEVYAIMNIVGKFNNKVQLYEIFGYIFDDTKRHELEKQIIQSQKLESIGVLAGGIAHDFNNILGIILGYTSLIEQESSKQQITPKNLEIIRKAVERGAALVRQILTFARKTDFQLATINMNTVIAELYQMIYETFPRTIDIRTELDPNVLPIIADQTQLHQALLNLSVNAKDAMPQGGILTFKTSMISGTELQNKFSQASAKQYVVIEVSDSGCGIPEHNIKNIFEPFFTTKERGKGTGLGLAVVYGIITSHQGFIDVESTVGKGTRFRIYLPVSEFLDFHQYNEETATTEIKGGGTILLIEDEDALREIATSVLETAGYTVIPAADGEEALKLFEEHCDSIDLVVTDLGLPKMDGVAVIKQIIKKKDTIRTIIGSGYFDPEKREELQKLGVNALLQKPYKPQELLSTIHNVLHK